MLIEACFSSIIHHDYCNNEFWDVYGEDKEEIVYFSLEETTEITKQKASDAFWKNPLDTPPFLILLGLIAIPIFVAWKRKWHIHEKQNKQEK